MLTDDLKLLVNQTLLRLSRFVIAFDYICLDMRMMPKALLLLLRLPSTMEYTTHRALEQYATLTMHTTNPNGLK